MRCQCAHSGKYMVKLNQRKSSHPLDRPLLLLTREKKFNVWEAYTLGCKSGSPSRVNAVFYIVDVPGPVILGLPTCEALNLVTFHCQLESVVTTPVKVTSVQDMVNMYPGQFDTVGKFAEPVKIRLNECAEPHVDRPRKCQYQPEAKDRSRAETDRRHMYNPESERTHRLVFKPRIQYEARWESTDLP